MPLALRPPGPPDRLTVRFLDVGQGDATLIQHADGTAVLFDGGPPEARRCGCCARPASAGSRWSSPPTPRATTTAGCERCVERMPVGLLLDGGDGTRDRDFRALLAAARERGARVVRARPRSSSRAGGLTIRVLSPPPRPPGPPPEDPNPRAVVALVSAGGFDLLLSADAESDALAPLPLPDVDAMKVPHHGSADPGLPDVLERLRPEVAAIEVGREQLRPPGALDARGAARGRRPAPGARIATARSR